eukprot:Em0015g696a
MRVSCTICTDVISSDFAAAPCGHTFHFICLSQWLEHQASCPQCREKCLPKNVIRLFIDSCDSSVTIDESLEPQELKERLALQIQLVKDKDKALAETQESLKMVKDELEAWQSQHSSLHQKLTHEQAANSTLKKQLAGLQVECNGLRKLKDEVGCLHDRLQLVAGLEKVLNEAKEEAEKLLNTYSCPKQLASFAIALKRDYESLKVRKGLLLKEKEILQQNQNALQKQLMNKEQEIGKLTQKLQHAQDDLLCADHEKENLQRKVVALESALETPTSRHTLRRIFESPLPECAKRQKTDLSATPPCISEPTCTTNTVVNQENESLVTHNEESTTDALLPVNAIVKEKSSQNFAAGYNGMGGQSSFIVPKMKIHNNGNSNSKALRFAPRSTAPRKPKHPASLPVLPLKF